jgi:hypothetical protein
MCGLNQSFRQTLQAFPPGIANPCVTLNGEEPVVTVPSTIGFVLITMPATTKQQIGPVFFELPAVRKMEIGFVP